MNITFFERKRRRTRRSASRFQKVLGIAVLSVAADLAAHDFWIEPSTYRPAAGKSVTIRLLQGDHFRGEPVARDESRIERFIVRDGSGERRIAGKTGDDPAGRLSAVGPGLSILGYRTYPRRHGSMAAERFEAYLREEGLEHIIDVRKRRGEAKKRGSEIFSRSAKSLIVQPGRSATRFDEPLGFRFEIIPESDPQSSARSITVRLVFDGRPLAGALVSAIHGSDGSAAARARSNSDGRVTLPIPRDGTWLIKAVHMVEAPEGSGVDWESIWATLTFERQSR